MADTGGPKLEALGQLAVERRLVSADQLKLCLAQQETLRKAGKLLPLGQILVQRRILTPDQVRALLMSQKGVDPDAPLVNGKYALLRKLGSGGAGEVYLARDTTLDRPVAIKVLREEVSQNKKAIERFMREARVLAKIRHPNVVGVHETGTYQNRNYFVMDYVDGTPLEATIVPGAMPLDKKAEIIAQVATAVAEVHKHGVVHRDLKPSNIIIDAEGKPVLLDFGLAHDVTRRTKLTITGTLLGTPCYMAPEQVEGKHVDARTDIYALGVLLYEMITGRPPFRAENEFDIFRQISSVDPPTPSTIDRRVSRDLETICLKAMDKDPAQRYATAADLADDLNRFLKGQPIKARPSPFTVRMVRQVKQHRIAAAAVAGSLVVALAIGGVLLAGSLQKSSAIASILEKAEKDFENGDLKSAETAYQRVTGMDPKNAAAKSGIFRIREREARIAAMISDADSRIEKNPEEAQKIYAQVLELDRENAQAKKGLANVGKAQADRNRRAGHTQYLDTVRAKIGDFEKAITLPWEDHLKRDPSRSLIDAIPGLTESLKNLEPEYQAEARYLLGRIYAHLGRYDDARKSLTEAIAVSPQGRYYYERGRVAISQYRIEYVRATADIRNRGIEETLKKLKPLRDLALKDFQDALKAGVGEGWESQFAHAYVDYAEARVDAAWAACLKIAGNQDAGTIKLLGTIALDRIWYDRKYFDEAEKWYRKAVDIYRSDAEAHAGLGNALRYQALYVPEFNSDLKKIDASIGEYAISVKLQESASVRLSCCESYKARAERLLVQGEDATDTIAKARDEIAIALQFAPDDPEVHNWVGIIALTAAAAQLFRGDGKFDLDAAEHEVAFGLDALNKAISRDGADGGLYHNRAIAYGMRGLIKLMRGSDGGPEIDSALADLDRAVELGHQNSTVWEAKSITHLWKVLSIASKGANPLPELNLAIKAADKALESKNTYERARMHVFRGILKTIRGLYGFMFANAQVCNESMKGAAEDFREAGRMDKGYSVYAPEAFESLQRAMELQLSKKDPKAEYAAAAEGLTKILASDLPKDPGAYAFRLSALFLRGFAYFYLEEYKKAIADWEELIGHLPPFELLLRSWIDSARKKGEGK